MQGKPFVGPAGKHLDLLLNSAGIHRTSCYLTNVVPYRPDRIDELVFLRGEKRGGGKASVSQEFEELREQLFQDLQGCKAKVVVAVGAIALYALTDKIGITKWRGSVLESPGLPGKWIVPIIHPSAALKNYNYTYSILYDLNKVSRILNKGFSYPEREYILEPTFDTVMSYMSNRRSDLLAFDIETIVTKREGKFKDWEVSCFSLSWSGYDALCVPLITEHRDPYFSLTEEAQIWKKLAELLEDPTLEKLGQNFMFDAFFLLKKHGIVITNMHDTMLAESVLLPDLPRGLDFLCSLYTDEPYYKDDGKQYTAIFSPLDFWLYNAKDSAVLHEILREQLEALDEQGNRETYEWLRRLLHPLLFIQARGLLVDVEGRAKKSKEVLEEVARLQKELDELCGEPLNHNSPKQVSTYFYIKKKLRPYTKGGRMTTDETALRRLSAKGHREASLILEMRGLTKLRGTYLEMPLDPDNRMRSSFDPGKTVTGRLSSSKTIFGTGGNTQNLPRPPAPVRCYIIPDPGNILIELDYSQAENRIVAYIAPEQTMIEAFESETDLHALTGSLISGLTYDEVLQQHKEGICPPIGKGDSTWRQLGKTANHSLNYGIGVDTFAVKNELERSEASMIRSKYYAVYPGIRQYQSWIEDALRHNNRTLQNLLGRKRKFLGRMDQKLFETGYAYPPQSTVADLINRRGLIPVYEDQDRYGALILQNQVHDSIVLELPMDHVEWGAIGLLQLKESLERPVTWRSRSFSIPVDCKIGLNYGEMKSFSLKGTQKEVAENLCIAYDALKEEERNGLD